MELSTDLKKTRKKQSIFAPKESAIPNPRRSKRIMLKRASGTKSENMKRVEEFLLEEKAKSTRASVRARAAEFATFEKETIDLTDENTDLEELHKTMGNRAYSHYARNEEIMMGIRWLRMMASNATIASSPFPFNPGNSVDLLPNRQGREHSAEMLSGFAGASSSAARGDDVLPQCMADDNHSPDDSSRNNGLAKGSGKPADLAPTD
ncbi:uncharacterized protein LOC130134986 [Syzygium oleosum]|uniref:uncharacterized protein LOC130134986 n=1 Tax=Syzygium oleosum TaxID=219896 RepID=UPI0024BBD1E9|nr:uncharacterized protein LOC130134986 [Syzygium oleosum]